MDNISAAMAARKIYNKIRNLVKEYEINFRSNDQFIEECIKDFLITRSAGSLKDREVYHNVEIDLCHGLIYILGIVEKLQKEYPGLSIRYLDYYVDRSRTIIAADLKTYKNSICLQFTQFRTYIYETELGAVVEWYIGINSNGNSELKKNTLLKTNASLAELTKSIQADVWWLIDEIQNN